MLLVEANPGRTRSDYMRVVVNRWPAGYVSRQGLGKRLGVSLSTLDNWIRRADLPKPGRVTAVKVGWPADVIEAWMATRADTARDSAESSLSL